MPAGLIALALGGFGIGLTEFNIMPVTLGAGPGRARRRKAASELAPSGDSASSLRTTRRPAQVNTLAR